MPPVWRYQIEDHEILRDKGLDVRMSLAVFEHHAGDSTFWPCSTPILRRTLLRMSGVYHLFSPSTNLTREPQPDGYLEYLRATKGLYIYKHPCHLWESSSDLRAQQSASLATVPDGWLSSTVRESNECAKK
ncbi:hypothetical protein TNCV_2774061 [Trichonephila clavipes]|nr:hypothetical protein TNCV_2774061 [Trichonephila clavipes]